MEYVIDVVVSVIAGVIIYYIRKWLDRNGRTDS